MARVKLFVDAHVYDGEFQGTRTYLKELYRSLLKQNTNIDVCFGACNIASVKQDFGEFGNVSYVEYSASGSLKRIFYEIPKIIQQQKYDYAHFQYVIPFIKNKGCQYIVTVHDILFNDFPDEFPWLYRFQRNTLFKYSAKNCDHLLTVSEYSKQRIASTYSINPETIIVTPNGVSDDFHNFQSSKALSRELIKNKYSIGKYFLYVSRIEPRKNQSLVLDWFLQSELKQQGYELVFIGKNSLDGGFTQRVMEVSGVHWFSQVEYEYLLHFYNAAQVFLYPSKGEGFGIPPLEAAAMLTPVVSSNVTAMQDFDFFNPYMFSPEISTVELDEIVHTILNEQPSDDLQRIKNQIDRNFKWEVSANLVQKILV